MRYQTLVKKALDKLPRNDKQKESRLWVSWLVLNIVSLLHWSMPFHVQLW